MSDLVSANRTIVFFILAATLWPTQAYAAVKVSFANQARYTDGTFYDADATGAIKAHLQRLGSRYLGRNDTLSITVLNLDLAGHDLSSMGPSRLRVLNGATPPKITLRYRLERKRKLVISGEDSLSEPFLSEPPGRKSVQ
jgi:hypothetical protein